MPTRPVKAPTRARKSKTEIRDEFENIRERIESARETTNPKTEEAARVRENDVRQAVEELSVETVVKSISGLGLEISRSLSNVSAKLVEEVELLASVREAVALERKELDRLHNIDTVATAVDEMVQDYTRQKETLDAEIEAQRTKWEDEARTVERDRKEQEETLRKQRQRDIDDYEYKKHLERKKAQDKYEEELRLQEKKNQEELETLERSWQQRESALKDQEEELARLRKESEGFPLRLKNESEAAAAEAARVAEARVGQEILLLKKDADAERRMFELQVKTLDDTISRQTVQIAALEKQLSEAKQQVQDIAVKAIEGASGSKALSHINQIAMEQAKNRPQG